MATIIDALKWKLEDVEPWPGSMEESHKKRIEENRRTESEADRFKLANIEIGEIVNHPFETEKSILVSLEGRKGQIRYACSIGDGTPAEVARALRVVISWIERMGAEK